MYKNVGEKIKGLAVLIFALGSIASIVVGIILWDNAYEILGPILVFGGPVLMFVNSLLIYGFGEIITKLCDIEQNTRGGRSKTQIKENAQKVKQDARDTARREAAEQRGAKEEALEREAEKVAKEEAKQAARDNNKYIDVVCPNCTEPLSFEVGTEDAQCPFCDCEINLKK